MVTRHVINISHEAVWCFTLMLLIAAFQQCGSETPPEYRTLFRMPSQERESKFKQFPIEKQVDVYVYAMYVEPPMTEFVDYLASNGKKAIPHILARLEVEKSDTVKTNLVYVLKEMHQYRVSLKTEEATVSTLERIVSNMSDEYNKRKAEEYVATIKNTAGFDQ
jgi:hypothetical protein